MPEEAGRRAQHHSENDEGLIKKERSKTMAVRLIPVENTVSRPNRYPAQLGMC